MNQENILVKEHSFWAAMAAKKLRTKNVAMVLGKTIHLHNVGKEEFLRDEKWVRHERCHLEQYKKHRTLGFIIKYLWESIKKGYHNNKFEVEAREAEGS
jgi:hypothetical protein